MTYDVKLENIAIWFKMRKNIKNISLAHSEKRENNFIRVYFRELTTSEFSCEDLVRENLSGE